MSNQLLLQDIQALRKTTVDRIVHLRAVIEFSSFCYRNCHYCGMRAENKDSQRYRLNEDTMVRCAKEAVQNGIKIVMLQGGDDLRFNINALVNVVSYISTELRATVLLCVGDRPVHDYQRLRDAGATQAIVKFETSNPSVYSQLRPHSSLNKRTSLIRDLVSIGFQVSSGFIQGLPGMDESDVERDIEMVLKLPLFAASVSPFIPSGQTPLKSFPSPKLNDVLNTIARLRLAKPSLLIPSVSALNLLSATESGNLDGQLEGLLAGANVLTINYSPKTSRDLYLIYRKERWIVELEYAINTIRQAGLIPSTDLLRDDTQSSFKRQ